VNSWRGLLCSGSAAPTGPMDGLLHGTADTIRPLAMTTLRRNLPFDTARLYGKDASLADVGAVRFSNVHTRCRAAVESL